MDDITPKPRRTLFQYLRSYFITGLVVSAPLFFTFYIIYWFIGLLDNWFKPLIPPTYRPEYYIPFDIPGTGVLAGIVIITVIGWFAANFLGRAFLRLGERIIHRLPIVGSLYTAIKQIFKTAISQDSKSFSQVVTIEYPRTGIYAIGFVTTDAPPMLNEVMAGDMVAVFVPTTPNPTSGFLLYVPRAEIKPLDMSIEHAARLLISAGLSTDDGSEDD